MAKRYAHIPGGLLVTKNKPRRHRNCARSIAVARGAREMGISSIASSRRGALSSGRRGVGADDADGTPRGAISLSAG